MSAPAEAHIKRGHVITFSLLALFSLIEWIIAAALVSYYNKDHNYPSNSVRDRVRFLLFAGLWTFVFSFVYIAGFLTAATNFLFSIASHVVWLFVTWVFQLAGTAALSSALGGSLDCSFYNGPHCSQLNALEAFGWICWILLTFMLAFAVWIGARSARSGNGFGGAVVSV
ncbi:hypothetical protein JCM8115_003652 [Rhodotorula mucilaginosa]|uniref:MARVEL domain-containing protein n=1 Tax=Rhodotorula mucilaginosa TaxID=5537 RepID=A0A9P7B9H5_RHOMI|nr:hypothetical protein C6P46_006379 [Rhodotorula mucilaginosa]KWU47437.1 hypothetical protein RHOSPDRAFT_30862 [Rhodotorula sp. JG-1b]TKA57654.1 hypothetical protein B0A53_00803 [Rhodotorula sp. CCFEE 5036]